MKIMITGSSGMIGTRLSEFLSEHNVVRVDKKENTFMDVQTIICDLSDANQVKSKLFGIDNVDVIVHLAANARVHDLVQNPVLSQENINSTFNVFEYARLKGIKRIIFASSREVYGNLARADTDTVCENEMRAQNCESTYTASKIYGEALAHAYNKCYGIKIDIIRFSNVFGMYDFSDRFIPLMIKKLSKNEDVIIYGAHKILDFTYIDDAINGIILLLMHDYISNNNTFNIASGEGQLLFNVCILLKTKLNSNSIIRIEDSRVGEVFRYVANIVNAVLVLNYKPKITFAEGINKTILYYFKNHQ